MAQPARFGDKMCVDVNILSHVTNKKLGIWEGDRWGEGEGEAGKEEGHV